jgi:uncharacterized membrane protein
MQNRDIIHQYLTSLSKYLSRLDTTDANEVIKEIESHIYNVIEDREEENLPIIAKDILAGFGEPRELAAQYVDHILEGKPPPKGFRAIQQVKKGATWGLYLGTAVFGYGIALTLFFIALYKPFAPLNVGVWSQGAGRIIILSFGGVPSTPEVTHEILGWWIIPVALVLSFAIAYLTRRLLGILKMQI